MVLQFSIYLSFYLLYTDAAYTSLLASFHLNTKGAICHMEVSKWEHSFHEICCRTVV